MDQKLLIKARKVAEEAVLEAGEILTASKGKFKILNYKDKQDILTNIDLKVEKHILNKIFKSFPNHNIYSEEAGEIDKESEFTWVIDPLDGTKEYIRGVPLYCSAVMLQHKGEPIVSAIYDPELKELYSAALGLGATLNQNSIKVSDQNELDSAMLFTYLPTKSSEVIKLSPIFDVVYRIRGHANHNMSYCWVAKGAYEGHFSLFTPTHWWDVAPGIIILKEAGGKVTNLEGKQISHTNYNSQVVGTNGLIHDKLLKASQGVIKC